MSKIIRLTKQFDFHMAHAIEGYDGKCSHIHGHEYRLFVTIIGNVSEDGDMVLDFKSIKEIVQDKIINKYDHSLLLKRTDKSEFIYSELYKGWGNVRLIDRQPTTENILLEMVDALNMSLPKGIELYSLKLCETDTSWAEWYATDNCQEL